MIGMCHPNWEDVVRSTLLLIVRSYRNAWRDAALRRELAAFKVSRDDQSEAAAWRRAMEASQWIESESLSQNSQS
jgi:hypothetical protein